MDFRLDDEQKMFQSMFRDFAQEEIAPHARENRRGGGDPGRVAGEQRPTRNSLGCKSRKIMTGSNWTGSAIACFWEESEQGMP